jgi:hypothetical protein
MVASFICVAQDKALVNTTHSPYAKFYSPDADAVKWTGGFWGHRYKVSLDTMVMNMLHLYQNDTLCHGFCNFDVVISSTIKLLPVEMELNRTKILTLEGTALIQKSSNWNGRLCRQLSTWYTLENVKIRLIPYFAWDNRGKSEMSVWMPVNTSGF